MVRCIQCPKFRREDCMCYRDPQHPRQIKVDDIHKSIRCDGFPNVARRRWLLNVAHRQALPEAYYQILGGKKK